MSRSRRRAALIATATDFTEALLGCSPDPPCLPEVTTLVRGQHVQARGEAESNTSEERVRKRDASQVDDGVRAKEIEYLALCREELLQGVTEGRRRPRPNLSRRLQLEHRRDRRLEGANEPSADQARQRGASPEASL